MKPACLPEQLLWSAVGDWPAAAKARAALALLGQCVPHSRHVTSRPAFSSMPAATCVWIGSPVWEAQARASSASFSPNRSAPPLASSGSACNALMALRGNTARAGSPPASTTRPSASVTTKLPVWRDSKWPPR